MGAPGDEPKVWRIALYWLTPLVVAVAGVVGFILGKG